MNFINKEHEERFNNLVGRGRGVSINDIERVPGMYIMSANEDLFHKVDSLYNFDKGRFRIDIVEDEQGNLKPKFRIPLSSSEKKMMLLAFDMYSGNDSLGINELFSSLDSSNREIVLSAIMMRY